MTGVWLTVLLLTALIHQVSSTTTTTAAAAAASVARFCVEPPLLLNAQVSYVGHYPEAVATYTCNTGFSPSGSLTKICRGGVWTNTGDDPLCTEQYCPSPPRVSRASYRGSSWGSRYSYNSVITYTCYSGYRMSGNTSVITCNSNLTWTTPLPSCIPKDCGPPPFVEHSNVTYTNTTYNFRATFSCKTGYRLGHPTSYISSRTTTYAIRCQNNGLWSTSPNCQPVSCGTPPTLRNGFKLLGSGNLYTDQVAYECQIGFKVQGNNTITCLDTGRWSAMPECTLVTCKDPPKVANSTITSTSTINYGNSTIYHCEEGFYMSGFSHVTCRADGTWTDPPTCLIVDCRTPPAIHFGQHSWTSTTYKSVATYACDENYKLIGISEITCLKDGTWDSVPACELPPGGTLPPAKSSRTAAGSSSSVAALGIACAVFGLITLFCLAALVYKIFFAHKASLFSYASYKNGEDNINSQI